MRKEDRKHVLNFFSLNHQLTVPKRIRDRIEQVLCVEPEDNKYFQNAARQFSRTTFHKYVEKLRKQRGINILHLNEERKKWDALVNKKGEASDKVYAEVRRLGISFESEHLRYTQKWNELAVSYGYYEAKKELDDHTEQMYAWTDQRMSFEDVDKIRTMFDFPPSWEDSIIHYIFTGELRTPTPDHYEQKYEPTYDCGTICGFKITVYGDTTDRHVRNLHHRITKFVRETKTKILSEESPQFYWPYEFSGKIDQFDVQLGGVPTIRHLMVVVRQCQKKGMGGGWLKNLRTGGNLKEQFRDIDEFERENPPGKIKDYSTGRRQSFSARSIVDPKEYARIRKLKERLKDHVNIF